MTREFLNLLVLVACCLGVFAFFVVLVLVAGWVAEGCRRVQAIARGVWAGKADRVRKLLYNL